MKKVIIFLCWNLIFCSVNAQIHWVNLDSLYQPLPSSVHVFKSTDSLDGKPNVMYFTIADLADKSLKFTTDTTYRRRITPSQFYQKNNKPLLVVNCSFFSFATNQNLNVVIKNGKMVSYNEATIAGRGHDTLTYSHSFFGALGISKHRKADVVWTYTDSAKKYAYASQTPVHFYRDSVDNIDLDHVKRNHGFSDFSKWKVETAVSGGPVLLQNGEVRITNDQERKFAGKAAHNLEPRTAIGYTKDNKLVVLVCEGRSPDAAGLSLAQLAMVLKNIGCVEALNLDGGGSSCMLINGKETNSPSSKGIQRPVPSVFLIERK
ncbi:MAG: phosphodiester glycosidase family protein [Ginsengibacter sp.]